MFEDYGRDLKVDPRIVQEVQSSPSMSRENPNLMREWGGAETYIQVASIPQSERVVYYAVLEGTTSPDQIAIVTGLDNKEVSAALASLSRRGLIEVEPVAETT